MIALQTTYLNWNLAPSVEYKAGQELVFALNFTVPKLGKYYLLGALYDTDFNYISGTLFGVLVQEGSDYAINSAKRSSLWELEADEKVDLLCRFILGRTDMVLGLFLMRMVRDSPSLNDDEQIASTSARLFSPAPPITWESIFPAVVIVAFTGLMLSQALKEE